MVDPSFRQGEDYFVVDPSSERATVVDSNPVALVVPIHSFVTQVA